MHKTLFSLILASILYTPLFAQVQTQVRQQQMQPQLTEEQRLQRQARARARQQQTQSQLTEEQRFQRQARRQALQAQQQQTVVEPAPLQQEQVLVREQQARQATTTQKKSTSPVRRQQTRGGLKHRWSVSFALLEQNGPFREFALLADNLWYGVQFPIWGLSNASFGISVSGAYDYTFNNRLMIRFQYGLESAGWITGFFDLGIGLRVPLKSNLNLTMEGYFSIVQTGATLGLISSPVPGFPEQYSTYLGIFGFKGRLSLEFALKKNYFIATYISYAVYPWVVSSLENMSINGFSQGYLIDALTIGIEFGRKF